MDYQNRTDRLFGILAAEDADGAFLTGKTIIFYLTGVETGAEAVLAVDGRLTLYAGTANAGSVHPVNDAVTVTETGESIERVLADAALRGKLRKIGYDPEALSEERVAVLTGMLAGNAVLTSVGVPLSQMRAVKEPEEIELIGKAVAIGDSAFARILRYIKPGVNEIDIGLEIERMMMADGAQALSYGVMVAAGPRSWIAHAHPIDNVVKFGDIIKFDFGCRYKNYCSDLSRTIFVGKADPELAKAYEAVREAQKQAIEAAVDGAAVRDVDLTARAVIASRGFPETNQFSIGHGIGIDIHEFPTISFKRDSFLKENMVLSVEPGLYLEGLGGVRIEDEFVVTKGKPVMLTTAPKELTII